MNIKENMEQLKEKFQKPISFKGALGVVAGLHILAGVGIFCSSSQKSHAAEDKAFLNTPEAQYTGIPDPTPTPKPTPEPLKKEVLPDGKVATYPKPQEHTQIKPQVNSKYTQSYTIKKGDTIHSIAKKYHLNTKRLIEINHITDSSKIKEGQVLKFL